MGIDDVLNEYAVSEIRSQLRDMDKELPDVFSRYIVSDIQHCLNDMEQCNIEHHREQFKAFLRGLNCAFWDRGIVFKLTLEIRRGRNRYRVDVQKYRDSLDFRKGKEDLFIIYSYDVKELGGEEVKEEK